MLSASQFNPTIRLRNFCNVIKEITLIKENLGAKRLAKKIIVTVLRDIKVPNNVGFLGKSATVNSDFFLLPTS